MPSPPPIALTPDLVELHRHGSATVHFRARVSAGAQRFTFLLPRAHATEALLRLQVHDSRGTHPLVTLPAPVPASEASDAAGWWLGDARARALPSWLRRHVGHHVDVAVERPPAPWRLRGTLLAVRRDPAPAPHTHHPSHLSPTALAPPRPPRRIRCYRQSGSGRTRHIFSDSDDSDDRDAVAPHTHTAAATAAAAAGSASAGAHAYSIFMRVRTAVVVRVVDSLDDLVVTTPAAPDGLHADAASVALAAQADAADPALPVVVETDGAGVGELRVSYRAIRLPTPLFDLLYTVDATSPALCDDFVVPGAGAGAGSDGDPAQPAEIVATVKCAVRFANRLPFALRDTRVRILDSADRDILPSSFHYATTPSSDGSDSDSDNDSDASSGAASGGASVPRGGGPADVDGHPLPLPTDGFSYRAIDIFHATRAAYERLPPFARDVPCRVAALAPGQLCVTHLCDVCVRVSRVHFVHDRAAAAEPMLSLVNASDDVIEAGTWTVQWASAQTPATPATPVGEGEEAEAVERGRAAGSEREADPQFDDEAGGTTTPTQHMYMRRRLLRPGHRLLVRREDEATVELRRAVTGRRLSGEDVVGLLGWELRTRVQRERRVHVELENKRDVAQLVLLDVQYETEPARRGTERTVVVRDGGGSVRALDGVKDDLHGCFTHEVRLAPREQCTVVATQTFFSDCWYDIRQEVSGALVARLRRRRALGDAGGGEGADGARVASGGDEGQEEQMNGDDASESQASPPAAPSAEPSASSPPVQPSPSPPSPSPPSPPQPATNAAASQAGAAIDSAALLRAENERIERHERIISALEAVAAAKQQVADWTKRWSLLRQQMQPAKKRLDSLSVDMSDDEDGEAVERFEAEVVRIQSRVGRLRRLVGSAEAQVAEHMADFEDAVTRLRETVDSCTLAGKAG